MPTWFARAFAQLPDPALRRPLLISLLGAVAILLLLWAGSAWALARSAWFGIGWLDQGLAALGIVAALALAVILVPMAAGAILSLFLDQIAGAVEARHYPGLPPPRRVGIGEQIALGLRPLAIALVANLLALPLYLIPGINLLVFYGLNGYILGREYFEMVAARRLESEARRRLWRDRRVAWVATGAVIAGISTLPVINLAAPVIAVAAMTHGFMALSQGRLGSGG